MSDLHLVIGNKNYSSWSMRPWLAMANAGLNFSETHVDLDSPGFKQLVAQHSRAGRVPVLHHGDVTVWESLAIIEYLAETFPEAAIWPESANARAVARAVSSEMHAGFGGLRNACPMNLRRPRKPVSMNDQAKADIAAIQALWRDCRESFGQGGPFLFGAFSGADAMFAPVVTRFDTYAIPVDSHTQAYMNAIMDLPVFQDWRGSALRETWIVPADEVD